MLPSSPPTGSWARSRLLLSLVAAVAAPIAAAGAQLSLTSNDIDASLIALEGRHSLTGFIRALY